MDVSISSLNATKINSFTFCGKLKMIQKSVSCTMKDKYEEGFGGGAWARNYLLLNMIVTVCFIWLLNVSACPILAEAIA